MCTKYIGVAVNSFTLCTGLVDSRKEGADQNVKVRKQKLGVDLGTLRLKCNYGENIFIGSLSMVKIRVKRGKIL